MDVSAKMQDHMTDGQIREMENQLACFGPVAAQAYAERCGVSPGLFQCWLDALPWRGVSLAPEPTPDPVNHPAHYTRGKIEVIDFIEDQRLDFRAGNVVKYVVRAPHKGAQLEDLRKARWYLDRLIADAEKAP